VNVVAAGPESRERAAFGANRFRPLATVTP
jgi:hypothetical protein